MTLKREGPRQYVKEEYPLSDVTAQIIAAAKEVHCTLQVEVEVETTLPRPS